MCTDSLLSFTMFTPLLCIVIKPRQTTTATPPPNHLGSASQICFVSGCTSEIRDKERKENPTKPFHFHRIPKDEASRALWVKVIGDATSQNVEAKVLL